jgi:hypothetical protein
MQRVTRLLVVLIWFARARHQRTDLISALPYIIIPHLGALLWSTHQIYGQFTCTEKGRVVPLACSSTDGRREIGMVRGTIVRWLYFWRTGILRAFHHTCGESIRAT